MIEKVAGGWEVLADLLLQPREWPGLEQWWIGWAMPKCASRLHPYADQCLWSRQRALGNMLHSERRCNAVILYGGLGAIQCNHEGAQPILSARKNYAFGIEYVPRLGFQGLAKIDRSAIRERLPKVGIPELRRCRLVRGKLV